MKLIIQFCRFFVGGLFIFSGAVKIVDPIGTAIKLDEYFIIFSDNFSPIFEVFIPHVVALSIFITTLEIVLGLALLFLYQPRTTIYLLFGQIVFFTILTFYSFKTGEVTDCGCFGDAIPLDPEQSFYKDLILLVLISILLFYRNQLPSFEFKKGSIIVGIATINCLLFAKYNLDHLPIKDFRPYKIGVNISEKRSDGKADVVHYKMKRDQEERVFEKYPMEGGWEYVDIVTIEEGRLPTINDFNLFDREGTETTDSLLKGVTLFLISQNIDDIPKEEIERLGKLAKESTTTSISTVLLTGSGFDKSDHLLKQMGIQLPVSVIDEVVIKAMIRSNPGIMLLKDGVVKGKWHINDIPSLSTINELI